MDENNFNNNSNQENNNSEMNDYYENDYNYTNDYGINQLPEKKADLDIIRSQEREDIIEIKEFSAESSNEIDNADTGYVSETIKEKPHKSKNSKFRKIAWVLVLAMIFGVVAQGTANVTDYVWNKALGDVDNSNNEFKFDQVNVVESVSVESTDTSYDPVGNMVSAVAEEVSPSIVTITTIVEANLGFNSTYQTGGTGSGIIFEEDNGILYIVTNYHVIETAVASSNSQIKVKFLNDDSGESVVQASVKGFDANADLAVITVDTSDVADEIKNGIKVATFGDSDQLLVGETAIAIGNPLGMSHSVTVGYISALNREIEDITDQSLTLIQTDAAINPGNSGGALLNSRGEVIGINTVKIAGDDVEGLGFAIPINEAKPIIEDIVNETPKPYLGIYGQDITEDMRELYGLSLGGIYVVKVDADTPAAMGGIQPGDMIVSINDTNTLTMEALQEELQNYTPGDVVVVKVARINQFTDEILELEVKLGNKNDYLLNP